jgi:transcription initiation factor TFIIB
MKLEDIEDKNKNKNKNTVTTCSMCNGDSTPITDPECGEIICSNCGMVISEKIEDTSHQEQWVSTLKETDNRTRTGAPSSLARHDMGLSTIIGRENKDAKGQLIDRAMRSKIERLRTWDYRTGVYKSGDRNLMKAFDQLDRLKRKLGLSENVSEKAAYIYRKIHERGLIRGRTIDGILAAAVYSACREMETARTLKDIAAISNLKRKDIARCYRLLVFELDIRIPIVDPKKCISRVASKLNISEKTKHQAINIMDEVVGKQISAEKDPNSMAATVLYVSLLKADEKIPQKDIAAASGVTEVTLRNRLKDLKNYLI